MKQFVINILFLTLLSFITLETKAQTPAFPGAEGAGMFATGGRGGKVLYVTSLDDSEKPGTLRWAVKQKGARTILFKVSGEIRLKSPLRINNGDVTIAGQSAPGDGICISDYETSVSADNVIIRFIRFRLGDRQKRAVDALSGYRHNNIIIDHCSMSWAVDENSSFYDNTNFTMQWCFITESLRHSVHNKGNHGYGGIWGGQKASFHHNLLAHNDSRNPRFCGSRFSGHPDLEMVDFRNNVIYNWGSNNIYAAEGGRYNIVNNYFKPGPTTKGASMKRIFKPDADDGTNKQPAGTYGHFFVSGNYLEGNSTVTNNNKLGVELGNTFEKYAPGIGLKDIIREQEFEVPYVTTHTAKDAYDKVLAYGGCSLVRDIHDKRYVENVKNGTFNFNGSSGSKDGLIDSQNDVGGWPEYKTRNTYTDSNSDGIPDGWLETNYPGKTANDLNNEGYTLLEVYLNSLVAHLMGNVKVDKEISGSQAKTTKIKMIIVDKSGNGDFTSVQEAVNSVRAFDPDGPTVILIKKGVYHEKVIVPDYVCNLKLIGEDKNETIISYDDHAKKNDMGTFKTFTLQIRGNDIVLENLTIENAAEPVAQAVALHTEGDRIVFRNCRFLGNQDTIYTGGDKGRLYFQDCYIEGTTDFIFGPATAWFENCAIHCKKNSYITAASTPETEEFGYIFNDCNITMAEGIDKVYLGRPWRPYAMTLFMKCYLPKGIIAEGWNNWRNPENEKTARYAEYANRGEGSLTEKRVSWVRLLTDKEAERITLERVFEQNDRWNPNTLKL